MIKYLEEIASQSNMPERDLNDWKEKIGGIPDDKLSGVLSQYGIKDYSSLLRFVIGKKHDLNEF